MTTLDQLRQLTDDALIEAVATRVMGWKETVDSCCPEDKCICWDNHTLKTCCDLCSKDERFAMKTWNPLTDWNHTMEVVLHTKTEKTEFFFCDGSPHLKDKWYAEFIEGGIASAYDVNPQRAICLAALLAIDDSRDSVLS